METTENAIYSFTRESDAKNTCNNLRRNGEDAIVVVSGGGIYCVLIRNEK